MTRVPASWLALREPADHDARTATDGFLPLLETALGAGRPIRVVDVGAGTGSNLRWIAPRLPGPQDWLLVDLDVDLLARAVDRSRGLRDRAGCPVHVRARHADLHDRHALPLAGGELLTASALLDVLTRDGVESLVAAAARARATVLFSLTVEGPAFFEPADPLDAGLAAAFAAHQRRGDGHAPRCGAEGTVVAADALRRAGYSVTLTDTPWALGPASRRLLAGWLRGWLAAAVEEEPGLAPAASRWRTRRAAEHAAGVLRAWVSHQDLLGIPGPATEPRAADRTR